MPNGPYHVVPRIIPEPMSEEDIRKDKEQQAARKKEDDERLAKVLQEAEDLPPFPSELWKQKDE